MTNHVIHVQNRKRLVNAGLTVGIIFWSAFVSSIQALSKVDTIAKVSWSPAGMCVEKRTTTLFTYDVSRFGCSTVLDPTKILPLSAAFSEVSCYPAATGLLLATNRISHGRNHSQDRFSKLGYSAPSTIPIPNGTFSESCRPDVSDDTLLSGDRHPFRCGVVEL